MEIPKCRVCEKQHYGPCSVKDEPVAEETKPKFDRKTWFNGYQKLYARDRRAAKKLGISTAEYRAQKAQGGSQ